MTAASTQLDRALGAPVWLADRVRWGWLKALGRFAKPLVRRRDLRVAWAGSSFMLLSLLGAIALPMWMLALSPIVWGTPHALSDLRYLWVRPGRHRRWELWLLVGLPLLAVTLSAEPAWGFGAALGALVASRGELWKKLLVLPPVCLTLWASLQWPIWTAVVFAHAHNFIAILLFWAWRRRQSRLHFIPLLIFLGGCALLISGAVDDAVFALGALSPAPSGLGIYYHLASLAPGLPSTMGMRLVLLFAFAQSVHYVVWVRLIPDEDRQRETPRTFAATFRALRADMGSAVLGGAILLTLAVGIWAAFDVFAARNGYLRGVLFHGHLELAALALLVTEGTRPRESTEAAPA